MQTFAAWSVRHRWWVIGGWVLLVVALAVVSRAAGGAVQTNSFSFSGYDSQDARAVLEREFPRTAGDVDRIVFRTDPGQVTDPAVRSRMQAVFAEVARLPHVAAVTDPYAPGGQSISGDGHTAYASVTFDAEANDLPVEAISAVIDAAGAARADGLQVELGGQAIQRTESAGPGLATAFGLGAAVLVLLVLFGSVTAMLMPILTALVAIAGGMSVNALVSHVLDVNSATEAIALMIALGVGVDYSLFIVSRFRALLAEGRDPKQAAIGSVNTSGRAVLFAGGLVVLALLGMLLLNVSITSGIAVLAAIEVAFTMAAALTVLPAVLSLLGRRVDSLRVPGRRPAGSAAISPRLDAWARLVRRARWPLAAGVILVLVVLALPMLNMRLGNDDAGANPPSSTTRKAYDLLAEGFGPGVNGPLTLVVELPGSSNATASQQVIDAVAADEGVSSVSPARTNPAGTAAVFQVYPTDSPQSAATADLVHRLRDNVLPRAVADTGVTVHVGGPTATFIDLASLLGSRLVPFVAVVVAIGFLVLLVLYRSLAIPLTAAVMNLLSIGAALGVTIAVFQFGWTGLSTGPINFALPVMMFAIVFGLSTDYQVFLLSRIQEEWYAHRDNTRAVHEGMGRVSGIITGAAVIMIAVFGSFVLSGQRFLGEIGVGLAVAVALDAFLIRFTVVPAIMFILGDANWWLPRRLSRRLPRVHLEPAEAAISEPGREPGGAPGGSTRQPEGMLER
ncbi:MAG: MMPL family transporter [Hamadaea sp.]|uniref:MMPL family transporter n=1 Tax=Hamadaea sp. TaxID=2024425 RepID=UPI00180C70BC|nr:MMPL family transporter [Hamadaea sp.]NUT21809.1 MMPL family transporter [Hamadaea sp.]